MQLLHIFFNQQKNPKINFRIYFVYIPVDDWWEGNVGQGFQSIV